MQQKVQGEGNTSCMSVFRLFREAVGSSTSSSLGSQRCRSLCDCDPFLSFIVEAGVKHWWVDERSCCESDQLTRPDEAAGETRCGQSQVCFFRFFLFSFCSELKAHKSLFFQSVATNMSQHIAISSVLKLVFNVAVREPYRTDTPCHFSAFLLIFFFFRLFFLGWRNFVPRTED